MCAALTLKHAKNKIREKHGSKAYSHLGNISRRASFFVICPAPLLYFFEKKKKLEEFSTDDSCKYESCAPKENHTRK